MPSRISSYGWFINHFPEKEELKELKCSQSLINWRVN